MTDNHETHAPPPPDRMTVLDLDALVPGANPYRVKVQGIEYEVRQIFHLCEWEETDLQAMDRAVAAAGTQMQRADGQDKSGDELRQEVQRALFDRAFKRVRIFVPTMPEIIVRRMDLAQATAIAGQAWAYSFAHPSSADTGAPSDVRAGSSKPVSADGMGGAPQTSAA